MLYYQNKYNELQGRYKE